MIDLHSHILPGVDDGARTLDESVEIARAAVEDGVEIVAATPHVREDYPTSADTMEQLVRSTQERLREERIPLELRTGGEIALDFLHRLQAEELDRFGLGGNRRYVLLEFPYTGWPFGLAATLLELRARDRVVVLAHPERNATVQVEPERLLPLVGSGALVQITAVSLTGALGRTTRETAQKLLELEAVHLVAGDAHATGVRGAAMWDAFQALGDEELAQWLTVDVPAAILRDEPLPGRPERRRRSWLARYRP